MKQIGRWALEDEDYAKMKRQYMNQKNNTKNRIDPLGNKIEFKFTLEEYADVWLSSGQWKNKGVRKGQYVMSRKNDIGHYEVGNVFIQTSQANVAEIYTRPYGKRNPNARFFDKEYDYPTNSQLKTLFAIADSYESRSTLTNTDFYIIRKIYEACNKEYPGDDAIRKMVKPL